MGERGIVKSRDSRDGLNIWIFSLVFAVSLSLSLPVSGLGVLVGLVGGEQASNQSLCIGRRLE